MSSTTLADRDANSLARELAGRTADREVGCVNLLGNNPLRVVDQRTLIYRAGDTIWVNRLERDCPGLRPLATVVIEIAGNRYCRNDRLRSLERGTTIPGPVCPLGSFHALSTAARLSGRHFGHAIIADGTRSRPAAPQVLLAKRKSISTNKTGTATLKPHSFEHGLFWLLQCNLRAASSFLRQRGNQRFILSRNCGFSATESGISALARKLGLP